MKKRLTAILTAMAIMLTGCAGNTGTVSDNADSGTDSTASGTESGDSRYEIITATEMAEKMGLVERLAPQSQKAVVE